MKCKVCKNNIRKASLCPVCKSAQEEKLIFSTLGTYTQYTMVQQQEVANNIPCFLMITDKRLVALDSYKELNAPSFMENLVGAKTGSNTDSILVSINLDDIVDVQFDSQRELFGKKETCTLITKQDKCYMISDYIKAFSKHLQKLVKVEKPQISQPKKAANIFYSEAVKQALNMAYSAHHKQLDKAGIPYIFHPFHIAQQMTDETAICVALLHDVLEDSSITVKDLEKQGIAVEVIAALRLLKHEESVPYIDYIQRIKDSGNTIAIAVKLADLRHNSDVGRLAEIDDETKERIEKYSLAIKLLEMK